MRKKLNRNAIALLGGMVFTIAPALCSGQASSGYTISTIAGNGTQGFSGDGSQATSAELAGPTGIALDKARTLYITDQYNHRLRQVPSSGTISTAAGNGTAGYSGDGKVATNAELYNPFGVAVDSSGNFYIGDSVNSVVRKVTSSDTISTYAGNYANGPGYTGDGGTAINAQLNTPSGLAIDNSGNLYIADTGNNVIRMVAASGTISTFAGNTNFGASYSGDGGPATSAALNAPQGVAVDAAGNLYIADTGNNRVRMVSNGIITTVAGNGIPGFLGDGGPALNAELNVPEAVAVDSNNNIYIADKRNSRIRKVVASGAIETIAGNGRFAYSGDGGPGTSASLYFPTGVAVDSSGNVYVADNQNNVIRMLAPAAAANNGAPAIGGVVQASAFGAMPSVAPGSWMEIYGSNLATTTRSWGSTDFKNGNAPISLSGTTVTIGGQSAFISYISGGQVNAQVPSGAAPGAQSITVTNAAGTSTTFPITVNSTEPGIYAPASFNIGGKQYVAAYFSDGTTYVLPPNSIPGIASREAKPGDIITIYGVGFGPVTPNIPAGQIVTQNNTLASPLQVFFGQTPATLQYQGLAPDEVGVYQLNVVVPQVSPDDAMPLTFTLNGVSGTQALFTAVQSQ